MSKLFPQTAGIADKNLEEIRREQQKKDEEEKKEKESSWKRMKLGFVAFGVSATVMGGWVIYDFGAPERDADGQIIEDEFSKLPVVQQYVQRMWKSLTYYQKVIHFETFK